MSHVFPSPPATSHSLLQGPEPTGYIRLGSRGPQEGLSFAEATQPWDWGGWVSGWLGQRRQGAVGEAPAPTVGEEAQPAWLLLSQTVNLKQRRGW